MQKEQDPQTENQRPTETYASDAKKLSDQHMADPNHVITEEDMRNIRVGVTPSPDAPTQAAISEAKERVADRKSIDEEDTLPGSQKISPWDVVE
ncbi:MAG: hypothetical protein EOO14_08065 [Chitinophagaceae bacterium]|nr:MAG: hypothetical protein EOO14_08065 [Chitinophagaceae bacterium]